MKIQILKPASDLLYAYQELKKFLAEFTDICPDTESPSDPAAVLTLSIDVSMEPHWYAVSGNGKQVLFRGGSASAVLCAVYDALSDAGLFFQATGYSAPCGFDLTKFLNISKTVHPKCRLRGIRQHINFPMDISSYSLKEAKDYIRSVARMGSNAITFHSYGGQWHEEEPGKDFAGHFFYGQRHPVPSDPETAARIHNRSIFCIPEAEECFDDEKARGEFAKYWLNEVMNTAKEACMTVSMSVELPFDDDAKNGAMLAELCRTYPQIDTLELITSECGGGDSMPELNRDNAEEMLAEIFGRRILDENGHLPGLGSVLPGQLAASIPAVRRIYHAVENKELWTKDLDRVPGLRAGIYLTCSSTLKILRPLFRVLFPDIPKSLLSSHGAQAVAETIAEIGMTDADWQDYMIYSWAEFDGNMYLQQLSTDGIGQLSALPHADSIYGICINHWRTAENNLTLSYAAETFCTPLSCTEYYFRYAKKIGIADTGRFAAACRHLAALDTYNRDHLFNIGFCYVGCWFKKGTVVRPRGYALPDMEHSMNDYREIAGLFEALLPGAETEEAIAFLRLMINRCKASIEHIRSMYVLKELNRLYDYDHPQTPDDETLASMKEILSTSRKAAGDFIHLYGEMLPDRGGEGLLASYCETTPVYIDAVASNFVDDIREIILNDYDAPPSPDETSKK